MNSPRLHGPPHDRLPQLGAALNKMTVTILRVTIECGEYLENLNLKNTQRDLILHIVFAILSLVDHKIYIY